jgi:hypothetical protein
MAWKDLWYGSNRSAAHRYLTNGLVLGTGVGVYGSFVEFVPSSVWWAWGTYLSCAATIVCLIAIFRGFKTGQLKSQPCARPGTKFVGIIFLPVFLFCICWLVIARAVPDTVARVVGVKREITVPLQAVYRRGTKSRRCEYRLEGEFLERAFPARLCVSPAAFSFFPSNVRVTLVVEETALGFHIVGFHEASANKRLQATRETRAPEA